MNEEFTNLNVATPIGDGETPVLAVMPAQEQNNQVETQTPEIDDMSEKTYSQDEVDDLMTIAAATGAAATLVIEGVIVGAKKALTPVYYRVKGAISKRRSEKAAEKAAYQEFLAKRNEQVETPDDDKKPEQKPASKKH